MNKKNNTENQITKRRKLLPPELREDYEKYVFEKNMAEFTEQREERKSFSESLKVDESIDHEKAKVNNEKSAKRELYRLLTEYLKDKEVDMNAVRLIDSKEGLKAMYLNKCGEIITMTENDLIKYREDKIK